MGVFFKTKYYLFNFNVKTSKGEVYYYPFEVNNEDVIENDYIERAKFLYKKEKQELIQHLQELYKDFEFEVVISEFEYDKDLNTYIPPYIKELKIKKCLRTNKNKVLLWTDITKVDREAFNEVCLDVKEVEIQTRNLPTIESNVFSMCDNL